jgi:hypothetical protein
MIFSKLKLYLATAGAVLLAGLVVAVRLLTKQNSRLRARAENAEARVIHARVVAQKDTEIELQTRSHRADIINELEETNDSTSFRNPDKLWSDSDD